MTISNNVVSLGGGGIDFGAVTTSDPVTPTSTIAAPAAAPAAAQAATTTVVSLGGDVGADYVPTTRVSIDANGQLINGGGAAPAAGTQARPVGAPAPGQTFQSLAPAGGAAAAAAPPYDPFWDPKRNGNPIVDWTSTMFNRPLAEIGRMYGATADELMRLNPGIKEGDYVIIPIHDVVGAGTGTTATGGGPGATGSAPMPEWAVKELADRGTDVTAIQNGLASAVPVAVAAPVAAPAAAVAAPTGAVGGGSSTPAVSTGADLGALMALYQSLQRQRDAQAAAQSI